jgi:hypothetical protein
MGFILKFSSFIQVERWSNRSRTTRVRPAATLPCVLFVSHETFYVLLFVIDDLGPLSGPGFGVGETAATVILCIIK